jgi:primosomal protein N'
MLVKCPACYKEISAEADICIHCGQPMNKAIKCPTCKSTDVEKIGTGNKVGSALMFGVFSLGHISKSYKCKKCGYKW